MRMTMVISLAAVCAFLCGCKPNGGATYWAYETDDFVVQVRHSAEMEVYDKSEFIEKLNRRGNSGWELVSLVEVPDAYPSETKARYRATFKKPSKQENYLSKYDPAKAKTALEAEFKAQKEAMNNGGRAGAR